MFATSECNTQPRFSPGSSPAHGVLEICNSENLWQSSGDNPLSACPTTKWSNTLKQFVGKKLINCLSVFDHFVGLVLKGLKGSLIHFNRPTISKKKKAIWVIITFEVKVIILKRRLLDIWDKVFKNGPSKIYGRQPLKNLNGYGLLKQAMSLQIF